MRALPVPRSCGGEGSVACIVNITKADHSCGAYADHGYAAVGPSAARCGIIGHPAAAVRPAKRCGRSRALGFLQPLSRAAVRRRRSWRRRSADSASGFDYMERPLGEGRCGKLRCATTAAHPAMYFLHEDQAFASVDRSWLLDALFVFEGNCTFCFRKHEGVKCDKPFVRDMMVGLDAEVLNFKHFVKPATEFKSSEKSCSRQDCLFGKVYELK